MTPADVMAQLGIHERRLRRFAVAYEIVFGDLPRDRRGHRTFTPEAVERIAAALPVLIERPALGMEDVLRRQAGVVTSTPAAVPAPEVLEVLSNLRRCRRPAPGGGRPAERTGSPRCCCGSRPSDGAEGPEAEGAGERGQSIGRDAFTSL